MRYIFFLLATTIIPVSVNAQAVDGSARAAALRFAMANGGEYRLAVPRDSVVVVWDPHFALYGSYGERSGPPMDDATAKQEAAGIARVLGPQVRVVSPTEYLRCIRYDCATSTRFAVVLVRQAALYSDGFRVVIDLFLPGAAPDRSERMRQGAMVAVERRGDDWIGVNWLAGSLVQPVRVPVDSGQSFGGSSRSQNP